jgi:Dolichyl-phosphate-mannose-protein mannosyltransferase
MTIVAPLIPVVTFVLLLVWAHARFSSWRMAFLVASVMWGVAVVVFTESLSLLGALRFPGVLAVWLATGVVAGAAWRGRASVPALGNPGGMTDRLLLLSATAIVGVVGLVALAAPPNTHDSMTYHMSRVAHWAQSGSVEHYSTPIIRQLFQPPWAEFAILQFYMLAGGDRLANLVQWFSMLGSLVGVSLVAKDLGGDRRAQILAALVAATIPVGVVQASSSQNDYVAAFWMTCLVVFVLRLNDQPRDGYLRVWVLLAGSALGLALLTKATVYTFALPFAAWACLARMRRDGWKAWPVALGLVVVAAAINAGHLSRNVERFGAPLGPLRDGPFEYANASLGARATVSVAMRNAGLHLGTPWDRLNGVTTSIIETSHRYLGLDVDDPATTWWGTAFRVLKPRRHEDMVSNGPHLALILMAVLALLTRKQLRTSKRLAYAAALVTAFLLFCAVLRWQPWHGRLHLPLFVLWAPLIGIVLGRWFAMAALLVAGLVAIAAVMVVANEPRPLGVVLRDPREKQYFRGHPSLERPYREAVRLLAERGCAHVGLHLGGDEWEYPLWVLAKQAIPDVRLEHVGNSASGRRQERRGASPSGPCGIVATRAPERPDIVQGGAVYRRVLSDQGVALFLADTAAGKR